MAYKITDELVHYCDHRLSEISDTMEYLYEIKKEKSKTYKELVIQEQVFEEIKDIISMLQDEEKIEKMWKKMRMI